MWFGVACLGALPLCVVSCGAVPPSGAVLLCSAVCLCCCLCLLFLFSFRNHCKTNEKSFSILLCFKKKLYTTQHTRTQHDHVCSVQLHVMRRLQCSAVVVGDGVGVSFLLFCFPGRQSPKLMVKGKGGTRQRGEVLGEDKRVRRSAAQGRGCDSENTFVFYALLQSFSHTCPIGIRPPNHQGMHNKIVRM